MASIPRDDNSVTVLSAINDAGTPTPIEINEDGEALAYLFAVASVPTYPSTYSLYDDNGVPVLRGVYNGVPKPILIDSANGGIVAIIS